MAQLAAPGADPTSVEIQLLASVDYYRDTGNNNLGFVTRLYDDVLRHDPTPNELGTALTALSPTGAGRLQLVQDVVLSPEARAIRVDQAFHTLLGTYPDASALALWVNVLSGPGAPGMSSNFMLEKIAASNNYYTLVGSNASSFMTQLYGELLNRAPTSSELAADSGFMSLIQTGSAYASASAREQMAASVLSTSEFRGDEVTSFFANYMHPTCRELTAQECLSTIGTPTASELSAARAQLANGTSEETIIAGVLGGAQYYQNHGSTQTGLIQGVYQDLLGRAPTEAEVNAAMTYSNDTIGHLAFATEMVGSLGYQDLLVSLDYQQLLLRAPSPSELDTGQGILAGDTKTLQTPDAYLIEQIAGLPDFYADQGGTDSRFVVHTWANLMGSPGTSAEENALIDVLPHGSEWQMGVAQSIVDSTAYQTAFINGVYAKFLSYSVCAVAARIAPGDALGGFPKGVPGGWFGLGLFVGVLIIAVGAVAFFALERRRFSRLYPRDAAQQHQE
jgi:hypothetical protein